MKRLLIDYTLICIMIIMTLLIFISFFEVINLSYKTVVILSTFISILGTYIVIKKRGFGFAAVYLMYMSLAHLGTVSTEMFFPGSFAKFRVVPGWFNESNLYPVIHLVGISLSMFTFGTVCFTRNIKRQINKQRINLYSKGNQYIFYIGLIFILLYLFILLYGIFSGSISIETYADYRDSKLPGYVWFLFLFRIGVPFCFATGNLKQIRFTSLLLLLSTAIIFFAGSRGEIIYPLAIAITILFIRGMKINLKHITVFIIIFFLLIPIVAQTRGDFSKLTEDDFELNFTDPFIEAGVIIRPYTETYNWLKAGEDLGYGKTYFIPVQRILGYLPYIKRPKLEGSRFFLKERTPTQGYSTLAEAYFNFGVLGIIIFPFLVSYIINKLYLLSYRSQEWLAYSGGLMVILLANIRGHFLSVPAHILILSIIFTACIFIHRYSEVKHSKNMIESY